MNADETREAATSAHSAEKAHMLTLAEVDALTGDDIAYWLNNPFMTPDLLAENVLWWVTTAAGAAKAEALRDAATALGHIYQADSAGVTAAIRFLRDRADRMNTPSPQSPSGGEA